MAGGVGGGADGSGGNESNGSGSKVSDGERWGGADEASLACLPLTSCCALWFLTGCGPLLVHSLGVGDPWSTEIFIFTALSHCLWDF